MSATETMNGTACAPNINARERSKRRILGLIALAVGIALACVFVVEGAPRAWRLLVFLPFWFAALGLLQAREKVCIALVARGTQIIDGAEEPVTDSDLLAAQKAVARRIHIRALLTAAVATCVTLLFPARIG